MSASSGLSQSLPLSFVKEHSHVLGALSRLPCGALVSLVAPWLVSSIDWGNDGQVDISDKLFGVNCGVLCLAIQLFYCVVAQYSVAPDHPLMGVLQALNIRTGVLSQRQKLVLALGELDIYTAEDLSRALHDEQVRPLVQRLCRRGLEFSKLCDVKTLLREENKKKRQ